MEKQKKKMTESIPRAFIYTILVYFLAIAEIGILSGFRFVSQELGDNAGSNGALIGLAGSTKGYSLEAIGAEIGWQFVVMSILLYVVVLGYCFWMGFHRQPGAIAAVILIQLIPFIGLLFPQVSVYVDADKAFVANNAFSFFWGYGTAGVMPMMSLFGLHLPADPLNRTGPIIFMIIFTILAIAAWLGGRMYRKSYASKYEFDLSVPLV